MFRPEQTSTPDARTSDQSGEGLVTKVSKDATLCPALFISATASGQGKTTITAGLARYHRNQGRKVRVFKTGPDYLDPLILEQAAGSPAEQLDLWMVGKKRCRHFLYQAAQEADLILIEGVMGLYDGDPSGADLAEYFGIPVVAIISAPTMAQTVGAIALGLRQYRPSLPFAGIIANSLGSDRHGELIKESMPETIPLLGCLKKQDALILPQRHLGLVRPHELEGYDDKLNHIADIIESAGLNTLPAPVKFFDEDEEQDSHDAENHSNSLAGVKIGIARDEAFSFIYPANLKLLKRLGAELHFFSPCSDQTLPEVDSLWLPGGYPELHLETLSKNLPMRQAIRSFYQQGHKILAECGGMLYAQQSIITLDQQEWPMAGLIPGIGVMRTKGGCQGMQSAALPEGELRGHAHHRSKSEETLPAIAFGKRIKHPAPGEPVVRSKGLTASYLHFYFPSNQAATIRLFHPDEVLS
ncbi:cobyrinate a,c-diamide synthase [Alkalimarinus sediminis]|uniref:Cobyrinate a,c-diamide synthase n=1 Tax=Alkalimarinus sediminis TaxID=1632866 RepID=A0A9E8HHW3_9ALTE|nr:cobyrinate a,c-diamide synthase [Alkalimarinus sediminis]UZW74983.1 cobyrinate a,c-diamide synthase [Alkalimarinus sediminis]